MMSNTRSSPPRRGGATRRVPTAALGILGIACLAYLRTMPPGLVGVGRGLWDSQETQAVGVTWGYLHPPGYPLQSLLVNTLAHTVGALPGVEPAWAVTLLSVLAMTLAVGLLYRVTRCLTGSHVAAALAMVIFAFSPGPWRTAITPEVYALNMALWALTLWLTLRAADTPWPRSDFALQGTYWWLGLALGLAAGHHRTAFLLVPAAGLYLGIRRGRSAAWGRLLAGMLLSVVVYLYLPLAHLWNSPMTPGDATSLAGFWELVSARAWAVFFHLPASFGELSSRLRDAFDAVADQLGVAGAGLGLVGLGWLVWQRPRQLVLLGLPALGLLAFSFVYQVPDVATMLGPMVMILCLGLGGLVAGGLSAVSRQPSVPSPQLPAPSPQPPAPSYWLSAIGWLLVVAVGGGLFIHNYPLVDESWDWRGQAVIAELDCELSASPGDVWLVAESGYAGPLVTYIAEQIGRPLVWANPWGEWDYLAALAEGRRVLLVKDMPGAWQYPDALTRLAGPDRYLMPTGNPDLLELVGPRKEPGAADLLPLADSRYVSLDEPFGPAILLRGYAIHRCRLPTHRSPLGIDHPRGEDDEVLRLTLYWESREKPDQDWRVKAHMIGADGTLLAQADSEHPARGARPTTRWGPGELVPDVHDFRLPPGADPLTARVVVGMYQIAGDEFPSLAETEIEIEIGDGDRDWR